MAHYIHHLHAFRGLAILTIVGAHVWSFSIFWTGGLNRPGLDPLFAVTETLFHGSTLYFALLSGLLFSQILQGRGWWRFFRGKFYHVVMPYVVMSLLITVLFWEYTVAQNPGAEFIQTLVGGLVMGKASIHLWYMPVLFVLFALTPLIAKLMVSRWGLCLLFLLMVAPLWVSRSPFPDFIRWPTFIYFAGAYAVGMVAGAYYQQVQSWLARYWQGLLLLALMTSVGIFLGYGGQESPHGLFSARQSLVYVQKLSVAFLSLRLLSVFEARLPRWLSTLGDYAFAVYFLHVIVIGYMIDWGLDWLQAYRSAVVIGGFGFACLMASVTLSMLTAWLVRMAFGRHSRKLVGA
jgi:surface polysaccharide O-acyltransferase-like enzyme